MVLSSWTSPCFQLTALSTHFAILRREVSVAQSQVFCHLDPHRLLLANTAQESRALPLLPFATLRNAPFSPFSLKIWLISQPLKKKSSQPWPPIACLAITSSCVLSGSSTSSATGYRKNFSFWRTENLRNRNSPFFFIGGPNWSLERRIFK